MQFRVFCRYSGLKQLARPFVEMHFADLACGYYKQRRSGGRAMTGMFLVFWLETGGYQEMKTKFGTDLGRSLGQTFGRWPDPI